MRSAVQNGKKIKFNEKLKKGLSERFIRKIKKDLSFSNNGSFIFKMRRVIVVKNVRFQFKFFK